MKFLIRIVLVLGVSSLFSCGESYHEIGKAQCVAKKEVITEDTIMEESGHYFSRIKTAAKRGLQIFYNIPKEHQNKELWVVLEGRSRTNYPHSNATITLVANTEKEGLCWKAIWLRSMYTNLNTWCHFKDSIFLPANFDNKNYINLNVFALLGNSTNENFDMDSLTITIKEIK